MKAIATLVVALVLVSVPLVAQVVPSAYVPLAPCRLYDSRYDPGWELPVETSVFLKARGACSIAANANAVAVVVIALGGRGSGRVKLWGSGDVMPGPSALYFRSGGVDNALSIVRLCYPVEECQGEDLVLRVLDSSTHVVLDVNGYFVPIE